MRRLASIVTLIVLVAGTVGHAGQSGTVIADVRAAIAQQNFARGEKLLEAYRSTHGVTPEMLEAPSWLGRGALAARQEVRYIDQVRQTYYSVLVNQPVPLSETNHRRYGVSTTPTLVLVDREGVVRLYHPGRMTEEELDPLVRRLIDGGTTSNE